MGPDLHFTSVTAALGSYLAAALRKTLGCCWLPDVGLSLNLMLMGVVM